MAVYNEDFKQQCINEYCSGQSVPSIAECFGVSTGALYRWLERAGVRRSNPRGPGRTLPLCEQCRESDQRDLSCSECRQLYLRDRHLQTNYGITLQDYNDLLEKQGGVCAICRGTNRSKKVKLAVDHDHSCCPGFGSCGQCVRGLLCNSCNYGIGNIGEANLERALEYVRSHAVQLL